jgi:hypothetical protein
VLLRKAVTVCCPRSLLNHMTVIPVGIEISFGSNTALFSELKGILISYAGSCNYSSKFLKICYMIC